MASTVDLVIPVYNEEDALGPGIKTLVDFLGSNLPNPWQITIADNASSDGTRMIGESLSRQHPHVHYLHLPQKGRGRALRTAWLASGADILSYMDVDLSTDLRHFPTLIQAVESAQRSTGVKIEYFRGVGNVGESRYDLKLELAEASVNEESLKQLGREIDSRLADLNIEYDQKRRSGRLHAPHVQVMAKGWSSRRVKAKLDRGLRDVQFKDNLLGLPDEEDQPSDVIKDLCL